MKWMTLAFLLLLSACASVTKLDPVVQKFPPVSVPPIAPLSMNTVTWKVLNLADLKALAASGDQKMVLFALDPDNYQSMILNFVDIQRYITQQKAVIVLLKSVVDQASGAPAPTTPPASPKK